MQDFKRFPVICSVGGINSAGRSSFDFSYKRLILDSQALKRQLKPNDVAQLVMFLASDQSSGCTKQSFIVDGGIT